MEQHIKLFANHTAYNAVKDQIDTPNVILCVQENEVHFTSSYDPFNGHDYVDLGLPSGTLWATMNVGASSPSTQGEFYAWGETSTKSSSSFNFANYSYWNGRNLEKYENDDGLTKLELSDDVAHVSMGGDWIIPEPWQFQELRAFTTVTGDSNGYTLTSILNGNTLYIPKTVTYKSYSSSYPNYSEPDQRTYLWTNSLSPGHNDLSERCFIESVAIGLSGEIMYRPSGLQVRAATKNSLFNLFCRIACDSELIEEAETIFAENDVTVFFSDPMYTQKTIRFVYPVSGGGGYEFNVIISDGESQQTTNDCGVSYVSMDNHWSYYNNQK